MTEEAWKEKLTEEGYGHLETVTLLVNFDDTHTHDVRTAHVILEGSLTLVEDGSTTVLNPGDFFEIPSGTRHTAKTGSDGCRMIVGWK